MRVFFLKLQACVKCELGGIWGGVLGLPSREVPTISANRLHFFLWGAYTGGQQDHGLRSTAMERAQEVIFRHHLRQLRL
jgi:hypothetical protein